MALVAPPILSDEALEQMSREELLEHLRKLQQSVFVLNNSNNNNNNTSANSTTDERRQRQSRRHSSIQMLLDPLSENNLAQQGHHRPTRLQWRANEDSGTAHNQRLSTSMPDDTVSLNGCGNATSILSLLSGGASGQLSTLPAAIPVGPLMHFAPRPSCDVRSFSVSNASMTALAPARLTDKLNVVRNEAGTKCINNYQIIKELGRGSCGKVQLAYDVENTSLVAIKQVRRVDTRIRVGGQTTAQMQFHAFQREIAVMKKLRHKNIVPLYEVIDDPNAKKVYLVMMYVDRGPIARIKCDPSGDLSSEVCTPIPKGLLASYARQILSGLEYLHNHKVVHRDIKPENILVNRNGQAYLSDFGVSEVFDNNARERLEHMMQESMAASRTFGGNQYGATIQGTKGTMLFIAPELWRGDRSFAKPVDMWAFGVTLYILLTGKLPFCTLDDIMDPALPEIPTTYGIEWASLLRGLLNRDPNKRLSVTDARAMFKKIERKKDMSNNPLQCKGLSVTEDEVSHALTLAQKQKDENDVEWLLGQHGSLDDIEVDEEEDVGIGYGLPCVISPHDKRIARGVTPERLENGERSRKTSPSAPRTHTSSPSISPRPERSPIAFNTTNCFALKANGGSTPPLDTREDSQQNFSAPPQVHLAKISPTRSPSRVTPEAQTNSLPTPPLDEISTPTQADSAPCPILSEKGDLEDAGEKLKSKTARGGIFASLRNALMFSRSKKSKKNEQNALEEDE
ncbi:putative protein kinase [Trypanosoma theileri]|uniref:non-specific serine/threonine protein kinase n=1 Tax=Trypanosoma theileri TaxID=67003 RepID=A0A1X0NV99_9TRYP|nr:putative protein kinase [Trypanosoma theileri]ORC88592.1 putative protein kinase [Trypanosoma theileri]